MNDSTNLISNQSRETSESQIAEFLQEHSEVEMSVPVMIGVWATSYFQLRGLQALLLNLAVASLSRQIFSKLKQPTPVLVQTSLSNGNNGKTAQPTEIQPGYAIVHSVPGRVRLRIERLSKEASFAKRLERLLGADDHVLDVRINPVAASVRIYYQTGVLSDLDLSLRLLNIINMAESEPSSETPSPQPVAS
jgi:hypothetical protein